MGNATQEVRGLINDIYKEIGVDNFGSIQSGDTESVVEKLLKNSLGDALLSGHESVHDDSNFMSASWGGNAQKNILPIPRELPHDLIIDQQFLTKVSNPKHLKIFKCHTDFHSLEKRHLSVRKDTILVCLCVMESDNAEDYWVFACPDNMPNSFGFVPSNYIDFIKEITRP